MSALKCFLKVCLIEEFNQTSIDIKIYMSLLNLS